ncbi:uncharacterized protein Bfra_009998 [Botrytis fragariae]|uniref:Uncharacterized protein n=1 Tax=Botrytis fragariae TaxID=1964551 RepID=A0A8H6ANF7_9HELO|nr:uncharacterized protein Bfra_009998 [Botrytis fragariae]KAF5870609.1 hypothetical protein Bfra_009998 [Botrytis fragariae]
MERMHCAELRTLQPPSLVGIVSQLVDDHMVFFKDKLKIDTPLFPEVNAYSLIAMTYQFLIRWVHHCSQDLVTMMELTIPASQIKHPEFTNQREKARSFP